MNRFVPVYLIPGAILQSVMIGSGYGMGREVVEYFTSHGVPGGFPGLATTTLAIAIVFTLSLEWGFLALYVVPLLTVGIYRLARARQSGATQPGSATSQSG